jgi:hypothetical protein
MTTDDPTTQERIAIPARSSVIGTDADGARHHLGNRIAAEGFPVYVAHPDGEIEYFDLEETPCADADDEVKAWIDHVEAKRGPWQSIEYDRPLAAVAAEEVAD